MGEKHQRKCYFIFHFSLHHHVIATHTHKHLHTRAHYTIVRSVGGLWCCQTTHGELCVLSLLLLLSYFFQIYVYYISFWLNKCPRRCVRILNAFMFAMGALLSAYVWWWSFLFASFFPLYFCERIHFFVVCSLLAPRATCSRVKHVDSFFGTCEDCFGIVYHRSRRGGTVPRMIYMQHIRIMRAAE